MIYMFGSYKMNKLNYPDFKSTFGEKMIQLEFDKTPEINFWPYVEQIPNEDFEGYDCSEGNVQWIYRSDDGSFEHVLIDSKEDKDVFMAIILNIKEQSVLGHFLLDLKTEYGLRK